MDSAHCPPFRRLPSELLSLILALIATDEPSSLDALKLVSRWFYSHASIAARSIICRDIAIKVCRHYTLTKSTESIMTGLRETSSLRYARRLIIEDSPSLCEADAPCKAQLDWRPSKLTDLRRTVLDELHESAESASLQDTPWCPNTHSQDSEARHRQRHAWEPVAELIQQLPALTDLFFRCGGPFPVCLLEALRDYAPRSRLHLQTFSLHGVEALTRGSPEHRLMSSSSVHSIMLQYNETGVRSYDNSPCYQMKTIQRLVKSAPNVKELQITYRGPSTEFPDAPLASPIPKPKKKKKDDNSLPPASLKLLRIIDQVPLTAAMLTEWGKHTNFSELETLELCSLATPTALAVWSGRLRFPTLKVLYLQLKAPTFLEEGAPRPAFYEAAVQFIQSLPPLQELYLDGWHSLAPIAPLVSQHGCCLRKLDLAGSEPSQCLTGHDILQIGRHCPLLESLHLMIPRSQGDATEAALYRALGTIPRLKYLHLHLDVSDASLGGSQEIVAAPSRTEFDHEFRREPRRNINSALTVTSKPPSEASFDEFGNEFTVPDLGGFYRSRNGHVQRLFRNSAIDATLACSIFKTISGTKAVGAQHLERMAIRLQCSGFESHLTFSQLAHTFPCEWLIQRNSRDDRRHEVIATRTGSCPCGEAHLRPDFLGPWKAVFQSVWPKTVGAAHVGVEFESVSRGDWRSFPLEN
ncbi:hypothetical protein BDV26DRAFT_303725 [Aspergillus bertholletiae]|uniref:F-box domain-containing protein n=1 Tax=Aspergillus bertholletiae TaxID=1226010 RepID=A0A5N7BC89_9EURO|nr:hypothetical protein BDV26DRAFT_303725 [Aspergillus bertholletiae]